MPIQQEICCMPAAKVFIGVICIEIDDDLLKQLKEILTPMGLTPEFVAEQFIRFCADPKNAVLVRSLFDDWIKKE